jgi:hypothetical protein
VFQAGGSIPTGRLADGVKLKVSQQAVLTAALESEGATSAAPPCTTTATSFAVFDGAGDYIAVELDGCRRTFFPNVFMAATSESVNATLAAAGVS